MKIDWWTLALQTANVLVLVWLLRRFFWRPVAAIIEERRATAARTLAQAESTRREAEAALAEVEATRAGLAKEREAILAAARADAEHARTLALDGAQHEIALLRATASAAIQQEKDAAEKVWAERAGVLAVEIAGRLAARLGDTAVRAVFLDWLLAAIRALPEADRRQAAEGDAALQVVSGAPLGAADEDRYRSLIGAAFACQPPITFSVDEALIAGLELRGPHFQVTNSWRADLAKILAEVSDDR